MNDETVAAPVAEAAPVTYPIREVIDPEFTLVTYEDQTMAVETKLGGLTIQRGIENRSGIVDACKALKARADRITKADVTKE